MKKIILARHAETKHIESGLGGEHRNDSVLSDLGIKQTTEMQNYLVKNDHKFEVIFTSLFQRTQSTATLINEISNKKIVHNGAFGEYFIRDTGKGAETTDMAISRVMPKIYSLFDLYEEILIVGHSAINKTIIQNILNMKFSECQNFYNNPGEINILRYDYELGDENWNLIDTFVPTQRVR